MHLPAYGPDVCTDMCVFSFSQSLKLFITFAHNSVSTSIVLLYIHNYNYDGYDTIIIVLLNYN